MLARRKKRPRSIELVDAEGILRVSWNDGSEGRYGLDALRRSCPCALCREARDAPEVKGDGLTVLSGDAVSATGEASAFEQIRSITHGILRD